MADPVIEKDGIRHVHVTNSQKNNIHQMPLGLMYMSEPYPNGFCLRFNQFAIMGRPSGSEDKPYMGVTIKQAEEIGYVGVYLPEKATSTLKLLKQKFPGRKEFDVDEWSAEVMDGLRADLS